MKNECDIVKDLLFSYNDGVLSESSNQFVEEHLKKCEDCKNMLKEIKQDCKDQKQSKEIDFFKKIKKKLSNKNTIICVGIIFLIFIIIFNILVFSHYNEVASTMEIYLQDNISDEEIENIKNKIIEIDSNIELKYVSKDEELERMKNKFGDKTNILNNYEQNNPLPASIEIKTNTKTEMIESSIQDMQGIKKVVTHENKNPYELFIFDTFIKK